MRRRPEMDVIDFDEDFDLGAFHVSWGGAEDGSRFPLSGGVAGGAKRSPPEWVALSAQTHP